MCNSTNEALRLTAAAKLNRWRHSVESDIKAALSDLVPRAVDWAEGLVHELRHVHPNETAGSVLSYLPMDIRQIVDLGCRNAPFETDATTHEDTT